jgi:HSP20 family molecular chaperone IbpA
MRAHRATGSYLLHERARSFHRELRFPPETDMLNVHACLLDGVLTISAPRGVGRPEPGDRRVEIRPGIWACHPDAAAI